MLPFSELLFRAYRLVLTVLGTVLCIHILCDYSWSVSAVYGVSTVGSFYLGQGVVSLFQHRERNRRDMTRQENDIFHSR